MKKIEALQAVRTKPELARLLGVKASMLTYVLYVLRPENQYSSFTIPKKSGGTRTINAPHDRLRLIQRALSDLLQDCIEDINDSKPKSAVKGKFIAAKKDDNPDYRRHKFFEDVFTPTLSHGFVRKRSIITNAMMHIDRKNVLNIDLKDFFDSFNFGRVRGFFIANNHFGLSPEIATVIAQIACYNHKLPQGSPCSPVITNLIGHILDIKLALLAREHSCTYTRYADDITFSTRSKHFPDALMREYKGIYVPGLELENRIRQAGFRVNSKKTRIQYQDSRQIVTGLVVNEKPNIRSEYWRTAKSQCHLLFKTGAFTEGDKEKSLPGNIEQLEGRLNFIDQLDFYNRLRQKPPLNSEYVLEKHGVDTRKLLGGRERTFGRFLYYRSFYASSSPTILCEGKTDNIYVKAAINRLAADYPSLARVKASESEYKLLVSIFKYTPRTRFLLGLYGGASYLKEFITRFEEAYSYYKAPDPENPVIIIMDNDGGFDGVDSLLKGKKLHATPFPKGAGKLEYRGADFIHVTKNLYIVLTPMSSSGGSSEIEDLFTPSTRSEPFDGKHLCLEKDIDRATQYGKDTFANKVILPKKNSIDFSGFKVLLDRVVMCIEHYKSAKLALSK
ncbi:RNA-directed DNA polymerase (Reverse transcriptase) [Pseudomonas syringae pv. actinidiae str. M302091]|uniref:retron Ec67 family RNA-directed DNA polymerase/endonuclease n=1 Tax=Pseudomonas syringae TaxID=317 RepID=UPI0002090344|nr:retron Ec67 family RNA-directed DNA polymerase/endonuclease [Pseudomonas syringae]EGH64157.1 RNA-directed DNA polymerase (Reverse transcriptase) [Pseudomonas syringae pv. actinidiae str. M302091]